MHFNYIEIYVEKGNYMLYDINNRLNGNNNKLCK